MTQIATPVIAHLTPEELGALQKPNHDARWWVGKIASVIGMAFIVLYCLVPFYWILLFAFRQTGSTALFPWPLTLENLLACWARTERGKQPPFILLSD